MDKEESIDLRELMQTVSRHKKIICAIIVVCTAIAMIAAFFILPKTYESTTLVRAKSSSSAAALLLAGSGAGTSATKGYMELMKSRTILEPIISAIDLPEKEKEAMTAEKFAKANLVIENTKGTDLILITAKGKSPEEAQQISQGIVDGFLSMMTQLNKNEQSLMIKFLSQRINETKKEAEVAARKLEDFSKNNKLYAPGEQAKAILDKIAAFDKESVKLQVQEQSTQAQLENVTAQLSKQNANIKAYNVADNAMVQKIRASIVDKHLEIVLLEQQYQEQHPSVIAARKALDELQSSLSQEVTNAVEAGTITMNPLQAELVQSKALAETNLSIIKASNEAIQKQQEKFSNDISLLSEDSLEYVNLKRDSTIKEGIYLNLVNNFEAARIQEAMDSMDIQVVDPADLPKKPAGPKKLLITVVGGVIGIAIAFSYILLLYKKRA